MEDRDLERRLSNIEECGKQNNRALRGYDGEIGLVARVELIQKLVENELAHLTKSTVSWPFLLERIFVPLLMAVSIGYLLYILKF